MNNIRSVTQVARNFAEYLNRVVYGGERFVLVRGGKAVAELGPVPNGRRLAELPDILASIPHLSPEEATAFEADIEATRLELSRLVPRDPWES